MNCKLLLSLRSQFFQRWRHLSIQANERSTILRCSMRAKVFNSLRLVLSISALSNLDNQGKRPTDIATRPRL
jgi:hypothetical protein